MKSVLILQAELAKLKQQYGDPKLTSDEKQGIKDQIEAKKREIEEASQKEVTLVPVAGPKVKNHQPEKQSAFRDNKVFL